MTILADPARQPAWSGPLVRWLARAIPLARRAEALLAVKAVHTAIFASVGAALLLFVWEGARGRAGRRAFGALGLTLAEAAVYVSNNQVCPLTPLAQELGAEGGTVADIFLPDWASRRIPEASVAALALGAILNVRVRRRQRRLASADERIVRPPSAVQTAPVT
jgi:hypothetical protein